MIGRCPGCKKMFLRAGGRVRFVDEKSKSSELLVCEECAKRLEDLDDYSVSIPRDR